MNRIFEMKLRPDPFNRICSGEKTIEYRLHDEKRSLLNKGDYIRFTEMVDIPNYSEKIYFDNPILDRTIADFEKILEKHSGIVTLVIE